ncbi:MAG: DUF4382 domain-containing protein [Pseudomonadota bacterium]
MKNSLWKLSLPGIILVTSLLASCGGGGGDAVVSTSINGIQNTTGTLRVSLTDAPSCGFEAVNITVAKVRVHQSATASENDANWTDITLTPARKINLLKLTNGALEGLGQTPLAAGHYSQIRLVLDANTGNALANSVIPAGSITEVSLDTPSAVQSGIKLINEFDVMQGQRADVVLDFDACKSIVTKGNGKFALKPVVKVVPTVLNGIDGYVNTALLLSNVAVTAQQNGNVVSATVPNAATGEFYLARLAPGIYDVVITADGRVASIITGVPVASTSSTVVVSSVSAPINLLPNVEPQASISGTASLSPASATEVAYVAAKQSFIPGPTVTIKYQGADILSGAYTLSNLPTSAPQLGTYSAILPIIFTTPVVTVPDVGKYRVEAAATGYTSKVILSVDVSAANQSGVNFALTP